ncbi:AAA family ATPase [Alteromonas sp. RKMC-009]|uniref:AAA family ATPase n=1 Tax=Alteromonas sp. RKMC-009 TaxID=2267264 RepID=UPI000E67B857|nr:AAA family ATPase [Alteromonas sp. RKMC-009]AYA64283.1 AAA family ATPase [Alteromonas sp. RKMC-009]
MSAVSPKVAKQFIETSIQAGLVPMLHGSPGIGKSDVVKQIAEEYNLQLIDVRLSQCDPTDLNGFPKVTDDIAEYVPLDLFPLEYWTLPKGKSGWLIFLDEINHAPQTVQRAAYKLLLDRMVGKFSLHPDVALVAAGNLETDGALVNRLGTAMQSRLVHIEMTVSANDWIEWAQMNGIDYRITSYLQSRPDSLHTFEPDHSDKTFACPRTWHFASNILQKVKLDSKSVILLGGAISEGVAHEFHQFTRVYDQLPDLVSIVKTPEDAVVPNDPSSLFALSGLIAKHTGPANATALLSFVDRMPKEFQVITIREMGRRYTEISANEKWLEKADELSSYF